MRARAVLVPPLAARVSLANAVQSVPGGVGELTYVGTEDLVVVLQRFGSLTMVDARRLMATLRDVIAEAPPLSLRFEGGTALEQRGDEAVWAKLQGDVDPMFEVVRTVAEAVRRDGFLVDRRAFRGQTCVATITDTTTVEYLQAVIDRLDAHTMTSWLTTEVALVSVHPTDSGGTRMEIVESFPLAGSPAVPTLSSPSHLAG